jgi:hypothetical protein
VPIDVEKVTMSINWSQATPRRSEAIDFEGLAPATHPGSYSQAIISGFEPNISQEDLRQRRDYKIA